MILLFIHQNFPGQYKHLVRRYAETPGCRVVFVTQQNSNHMAGVEKVVYDPALPADAHCHPLSHDFDRAVRTGLAVAEACRGLLRRGLSPDLVVGHNGWGEMLFVKDVFPTAPILSYFEFYYHADGADVGFDPEFGADGVDPLRLRARNAVNLLGFDAADWGNTPTAWQRSVHPPEFRSRLTVLHEGVDTDLLQPDPAAWLGLEREGVRLDADSEVVTYCARNLEPYRGFHIFMRAAAKILRRRPRARIVVAGGDEVSYGMPPAGAPSYRALLMNELGGALDVSRVHFVGRLAYQDYVRLLQISAAHVYLTYPFVLSWSFLEAMACGCALVGSDTPPVAEVLEHGRNGLLVDFFSPDAVAEAVEALLDDRRGAAALRGEARARMVAGFDLRRRQLPRWAALFEDLLNQRRPAIFPQDEGAPPGPVGGAPRAAASSRP
jgi:glycosyltransferase involved in cell wall biosynthesis